MNKLSKNQKGFTVVEGLLIIAILVVIGTVGYMVYHNNHKSKTELTTASSNSYSAIYLQPPNSYIKKTVNVIACQTPSPASNVNIQDSTPPTTVTYIPSSLANSQRFSFYATADYSMGVLAPSGWSCSAGEGVDSGRDVMVWPKDNPVQTDSSGNIVASYKNSNPEVIESYHSGGVEAAEDPACHFFAQAQADLTKSYGQSLPCSVTPQGETHTLLSATAASFVDPINISGLGYASGGSNESLGIIYYLPSSGNYIPNSIYATCTLPNNEKSLCNATLTDFLSRRTAEVNEKL